MGVRNGTALRADGVVIDLRVKTSSVALAHDYLTQQGGAERVVLELLDAFPEAPVHTSLFDARGTYPGIDPSRVVTLPLNRVGIFRRHHRLAFPVLAPSFARHVVNADVVLCSSSGWAHGIRTDGRKVVYCYAPARWLYQPDVYLNRAAQRMQLAALTALKRPLTAWDQRAASTADRYITTSTLIRDMIRTVYGIDAEIVPPPVTVTVDGDQEPVAGVEPGEFALVVSRLMAYKNVNVVIEAFNRLKRPLVVVGQGPEATRLGAIASPFVTMLGRVSDAQLRWLYANCWANVSASREDFGLTTIEAAAFGKATIALRYGGFLDTVLEGDTGVLFDEATVSDIEGAIRTADEIEWSSTSITAHASTFSPAGFRLRMRSIVEEELRKAGQVVAEVRLPTVPESPPRSSS